MLAIAPWPRTVRRAAAMLIAGALVLGLPPSVVAQEDGPEADATARLTITAHNRADAPVELWAGRVFLGRVEPGGAIVRWASVEPPGDKAPLGRPPTPPALKITLDTQGQAKLTWGGTRHGGTVFTVQRQTTGVDHTIGPWETIATVPQRKFVDQATPSGVLNIRYRVRGQRVGGVSAYTLPLTLPLGAAGPQASVAGAIGPVRTTGKDAG